jgi:hypothetical protein
MSNKTELRIYNMTLAAQVRIIKRLQNGKKIPKKAVPGIDALRASCRTEARESHLAYGFLRGTPYAKMELPLRARNLGHVKMDAGHTRTWPNFENVLELAELFGLRYFKSKSELEQRFTQWLSEANALDSAIVDHFPPVLKEV